jgi:hypothetical protein
LSFLFARPFAISEEDNMPGEGTEAAGGSIPSQLAFFGANL